MWAHVYWCLYHYDMSERLFSKFFSVPVRLIVAVYAEPQAARAGFRQAGPQVRRSRQVINLFFFTNRAWHRTVASTALEVSEIIRESFHGFGSWVMFGL